jgi:hypothetical protein
MKYNTAGIVAILLYIYAGFLTPAFFDPTDFIVSPLWITWAYVMFPEHAGYIVPIWMWTGYVAVLGIFLLVGKSVAKKFKIPGYLVDAMIAVLVLISVVLLAGILHQWHVI